MKRSMLLLFSLFLVIAWVVPTDAWVGCGGAYNGAAVGPKGGSVYGPSGGSVGSRPYGGCCSGGYNGYNVASPSTASPAGGSGGAYSVTKAADPNTPFFVAPEPVGPTAAIGTILYSLPNGCDSTVTNGKFYYQCGRDYYQTFYQAGTLVYEVVKAPY